MLGHFSKSDIRYWHGTVFRQTYTSKGKAMRTKDWAMKIRHEGRRETFPLGTPNKAAAAARARDIYASLVTIGWAATVTRFKQSKTIAGKRDGANHCTVGQFLQAVPQKALSRRTIEGYTSSFRKIVADLFGLADEPSKFDCHSGGHDEWLKKINSVEICQITPAKIQEWKQSFVTSVGADFLAQRRARISVNSILRQARSLFSPKMLKHVQLALPDPLPFEGVELEPRQSMKYRSEIDIVGLIESANKELRKGSPEAYKVFVLAVGVGLRRKEIDLLEWSSFRWKQNIIRIQPTHFFHPKSEDSIGDLPVDPEVIEYFHKCQGRSKAPFVIKSQRPPLSKRPQYYRCESTFTELIEWLRAHGVTGNKPLHTLRKEYGSLLTRNYGIHAASRALRHADLRTTSEHYSDSTARVTPGIGQLLKS
jgi:integrase